MLKSELQTGMWVQLRNGDRYMVLVGDFETKTSQPNQNIVFIKQSKFINAGNYLNSLMHKSNKNLDVVQVEANINGNKFIGNSTYEGSSLKVIYKELELPKYEFDPTTLAVDTLLRVRHNENNEFQNMYFASYIDEKIYCYSGGRTSMTAKSNLDVTSWEYVELYEKEN